MRKLSKILALVLVLMTVFSVITAITASAAAGQTWTVAGVKALCGTDWNPGDRNNDMTYDAATDSYVKVYTNVKAGSYQFKCAKNHAWSISYGNGSANYNLKVAKDGSTVTITLKGTKVTATVVAPSCDHAYEVTAATVTCLTGGSRTWTCSKCKDSYTETLDALGHYYDESGKCIRCDATVELVRVYVENAAKWANVYCYTWDTNPYVAWPGEQMKLDSESGLYYYDIPKHFVNVIFNNGDGTQSADLKTPTGTATVYNNSTKKWTAPHVCSFVDGKCTCGEFDPAWTVVGTLEELNAALVNGGNIILNGDITSSNVISITTSVVLNGNGHTLTYTGANRAIDVPNTAVDVNLTIKNLTVNTTASFCERGINYNTNGVLTLEKVAVAGTNINYAINLPGSSDNATVVITDSNITGNIALNVWGEKVDITANNSNFTSPYKSEVEVCSVIQFNNDGTNAAHGASLTVNGGSIISLAETVALSVSSYDTTISISNETTVQGKQETSSIAVIYEGQTQFYTSSTLQHAFDLAANDPRAKVLLLGDVVLDAPVVVTGTVVLDLNGFTLSYESDVMGEAMITNKGNLTINDSVGTGVINYNYVGAADNSYGKGNYTISNAGTLTVNGGYITIAKLSGHAKYPIDNNSTTGDAILVINGGHLYNYNTSAIRMFCNSTTNKNSVTINGGLIEGYSAIWMQNPGKNTVHGALTITGGEIKTTAKAWVEGTAELKDVASKLYCTIDGEGGAWSEDSLVAITGGTINENVYLATNAPANLTVGEATFNGNVETPHTHVWADATCTAPKTCETCGATEGEALGHTWADATCAAPKTCETCGATEGEALGHTPGAAATCTAAQTCTVCGAELVAKLGHIDANLDVECDREGCTSKVAPKADSVLSTYTANCLGSKLSVSSKYYVIGTIVQVLDQKNGIFLVDDGTGEKFYFRLPKNAEGVAHASWEVKLTLGDKVQLYGAINKYSSSSAPNGQYWPAMQGPVVTILEQHTHVPNGEIVCTKDTLCACGTLVAPAVGHIDADANGICDNCPWDMNLVEVNIAIGTDPKYNGVRVDDEAGKALSWTWSAGGFDAIISKGTSTVTLYTKAKDYMQLKKLNTFTLINNEDVTVKYIVISVTNATYLTNLKNAIASQYEYTADEANLTVTIQLNSTEDVVFENKGTQTVYINGVTIVYAKKGVHIHEFKETITTPATCTEAGLKTFTCECGEGTYTEEIPALGHAWVDVTCETAKTCTNCGATEGEALGHAWVDATCETAKTCTNCGAVEGEALGHKFINGICVVCEATYVAPSASGWTLVTELKDGDLVLIGNPAYGKLLSAEKVSSGSYYNKGVDYSADDFENVTDAEIFVVKVNADGTYTFTSLTGDVIALASSYSSLNVDGEHKSWALVDKGNGTFLMKNTGRNTYLEWYSSKNNWSTYTAGNTTEYYLSFYLQVSVEHVHNYITSVVAPTCTEAGKTVYACSCGDAYDVAGDAALGHTAGAEATCTTAQTCTVCGAELVAALGHTYESVVTAPTCTSAGYTTYTCACGDTYTGDEVAALEHNYANGACEVCGKEDPNYVPPHEHKFVEGKCECGEVDPNYVPEQPPVNEPTTEEPDGFAKIWQSIVKFVMMIVEFFKGLFVKA